MKPETYVIPGLDPGTSCRKRTDIHEVPSPNQDDRPPGTPIDILMLHYTGMQSAQAAIDRLRDPQARVSSHYVLEEDGTIWNLVPEHRRAWHAGISAWRGVHTLNNTSIGIEIVNPGHDWGYRDFPPAQMAALIPLCQAILSRHPIPPRNVVAHSDVAPDRKQDPGERFDWPSLAQANIGLWPTHRAPPTPELQVPQTLTQIGYPIPDLPTTLLAFQRRWLPTNLTAQPDPPTRERLAAVARLFCDD